MITIAVVLVLCALCFLGGVVACVLWLPAMLARWTPEQIDGLAAKVAARKAKSGR